MSRPIGISSGGLALIFAWCGGIAIARLTGATPVVMVLIAATVMGAFAGFAGAIAVRRCKVLSFRLPPMTTQGESVSIELELESSRPVWLELFDDGERIAQGWSTWQAGRHVWSATGVFPHRGRRTQFSARVRSAGAAGLLWWARERPIADMSHLVAARPERGAVFADVTATAEVGDTVGQAGASSGNLDGVRPWREGDSERFVHWASTLRSGELVVHDRHADAAERWVIRARPGTDDPDHEAGVTRWALEQGLRSGGLIFAAVGQEEPVRIVDGPSAALWSATAELGTVTRERPGWLERLRSVAVRAEPESMATASSRWWAAAATFVSLAMLTSSLAYGPMVIVLAALGVIAGALVSVKSLIGGTEPSIFVRTMSGLGALAGFAAVVASSGRIDGLLTFLRGPLPQILVILILLHGFELRDRRSIRVGLAISAVVVMYASGLRVDDQLGWWLLAWAGLFGMALIKLARPADVIARSSRARAWPATVGVVVGGGLATFALLSIVPIPAGPARLNLPTLVENADPVGQRGGIAGPGDAAADVRPDSDGTPDRAPAGIAGAYVGFASSMDTSVRGDLSDSIVMRVRAPEPDFWRGQTFAEFDGRRWYADDDGGRFQQGPTIKIPGALGDLTVPDDIDVEEFVQTFYLATDMPNLIFHAYRPDQVIVDADAWTRADGAIRASTVLPEGSIYTVVSARARVDEGILRRQGDIGERLSPLGASVMSPYLTVPASTTPETAQLAAGLAATTTNTYDTVRAYEQWLTDNVVYDLNAPVPSPGDDAVHDFLFNTQRGFCEQIASTLTVMLRTQGVPARLATGYLPGTRDPIAGVFEVKASDAHAWVEVWFPETGWQAFDPTSVVPLSANSQVDSVGADLAEGIGTYAEENSSLLISIVVAVVGGLLILRLVRELIRRRRRGRWGVLQDRFARAAARRGANTGGSNPALAQSWTASDDADVARLVADRLDQAAFDPEFGDDRQTFTATRKLVGTLTSLRY